MRTTCETVEHIYKEMDDAASQSQQTGGSVSWRKVREWAVRLCHIDIEMVSISRGHNDYLREYHHITNSAIGLAKMALMRGDSVKALEYLQDASRKIDEATITHTPRSAELQGLIKRDEHGINASETSPARYRLDGHPRAHT